MLNTNTNRRIAKSRFLAGKNFTLIFSILLVAGLTNSRAQNTWTQKASFGGGDRYWAVGFSIGSKGYLGTGIANSVYKKDFWEYDAELNTWTQKADFGGTARYSAVGFSIGSKGYIGTGLFFDGSEFYSYKDFWEYDSELNNWTQKADFGGTARSGAVGFTIGNKGYLGTGYAGGTLKDFWEYDPELNTWTQKADFGGVARDAAVGFNIGSKGYLGTGRGGTIYKKDFWEFDPELNTWTQKADFGGVARDAAVGFSIGSKGYLGTGKDCLSCFFKKDFWEYDPELNTWTQKADFGGSARVTATGFSIGSKGYLGTGVAFPNVSKKDFWEYTDGSTCLEPTNLSVTNITSSSAKLNWNSMSGAIGYKVRYKVTGSSEWTNIQSKVNDKTLHGLAASTEYAWQVKSICSTQPIVSSEWSEKQFFTTDAFRIADVHEPMFEVYPNPVSQSATASFSLTEGSPVLMEIMDVNGRSLRVIIDKNFSDGRDEVTFSRESLPAGIYFLQVKTNEGVMMKKLVIQ